MKKIMKLLTVVAISLALTGCMKIHYQINIIDKDNVDASMKILYSKEMMDTYGMTQEDIKSQMETEDGLKGWELKDVSEKIDGEEYVGFNAVAPESITKDILDCLTVENNTYTLKIEGDDLGESVDTEDFEDQLGYSIDKLEEMGLEIGIKITMPGKIKSSTVGTIEGNMVDIGLMDLQNATNEITVVSKESTATASNTGIVIGGIVVVILIAGGLYFYKNKKKKNDNIEDNEISEEI